MAPRLPRHVAMSVPAIAKSKKEFENSYFSLHHSCICNSAQASYAAANKYNRSAHEQANETCTETTLSTGRSKRKHSRLPCVHVQRQARTGPSARSMHSGAIEHACCTRIPQGPHICTRGARARPSTRTRICAP
eukprot:6174403-Pleurochrysis_carterae.AAC.1